MAGKKKIRIFYRAPSHVPLWKVMEECGFFARHGLELDFGSLEDKRSQATRGLLTGEFDVVSGNHHSLYARRALHGEPFVHIAQAQNDWNQRYMAVGNGINGLRDLRGKRVSVTKLRGHPGLNVWLFLRQNGLEDGKNVEMIEGDKRGVERVRQVLAGQCAATFLGVVEKLRAEALGARVLEQPPMPMIEGPTLTTTTTFVHRNPDRVDGLLRAVVDGIHFFKTERKGTLEIINKTCREGLRLLSDQELEILYQHQADGYQPKPYPTAQAIQNVFALGVKDTPAVAGFNPLVMWDLHHLRAIDDSGYIDKLYQ